MLAALSSAAQSEPKTIVSRIAHVKRRDGSGFHFEPKAQTALKAARLARSTKAPAERAAALRQVSAILELSDEYIRSLSNFSEGLRELVRKASIIEQTLILYGERFGGALKGIADVFDALAPVGVFYENHRDDFLEKVRHYQETARYWAERSGVIVRAIRMVRRKIEQVLDAETAPPELLATDLCMPVPGGAC